MDVNDLVAWARRVRQDAQMIRETTVLNRIKLTATLTTVRRQRAQTEIDLREIRASLVRAGLAAGRK